jgi:hypothetical protein
MIFEGEESSQAVQAFVKTHGLNSEKALKLGQVVKDQLTQLLPRIIEEDHIESSAT